MYVIVGVILLDRNPLKAEGPDRLVNCKLSNSRDADWLTAVIFVAVHP